MSNENEGGLFSCPVMCWIIGALLGVATYLILAGRFEVNMVLSIIVALVVFAVVGYFLGQFFCRASGATNGQANQNIASTKASAVSTDSAAAMVSVGMPKVSDAVVMMFSLLPSHV